MKIGSNAPNIATIIGAVSLGIILVANPALAIAGENNGAGAEPIAPIAAQLNNSSNSLITLKANETIAIFGTSFIAKDECQLVKITSSEFVTLAVTSGTLTKGTASRRHRANAGEAFIIPVSGQSIQKFNYDATRLLATINPEWAAQIAPSLEPIVKAQKRQRFWGLLEPTGVNTSAPLPPYIERVRASYLSVTAIMELRHNSNGNGELLQTLTAQKFKDAIAQSDIETIAALIDPLPFSDATDDVAVWLAARRSFAATLAADENLKAVFANGDISKDPLAGVYLIGAETSGYKLVTVHRDSAVFIAAVEHNK